MSVPITVVIAGGSCAEILVHQVRLATKPYRNWCADILTLDHLVMAKEAGQ